MSRANGTAGLAGRRSANGAAPQGGRARHAHWRPSARIATCAVDRKRKTEADRQTDTDCPYLNWGMSNAEPAGSIPVNFATIGE
jgi:hypothetical protein